MKNHLMSNTYNYMYNHLTSNASNYMKNHLTSNTCNSLEKKSNTRNNMKNYRATNNMSLIYFFSNSHLKPLLLEPTIIYQSHIILW